MLFTYRHTFMQINPESCMAKKQPDLEDQGQSDEDESSQSTKYSKFLRKRDVRKFLTQKSAAGEIDDIDDAKNITDEDEQNQLMSEFERWVEAGKPAAKMVKTKDVARITSIYRKKHMGKQKIYALLSDMTYIGLVQQVQYMKRINPTTQEEYTTNEPSGELIPKYTLDYNETKGNELLEKALKMAENEEDVALYIWDGKRKYQLTKDEFLEDYDKIIKSHNSIQLKQSQFQKWY